MLPEDNSVYQMAGSHYQCRGSSQKETSPNPGNCYEGPPLLIWPSYMPSLRVSYIAVPHLNWQTLAGKAKRQAMYQMDVYHLLQHCKTWPAPSAGQRGCE